MLTGWLANDVADQSHITADKRCSFCRQQQPGLVEGPTGVASSAPLICARCAERAAWLLRHETAALRRERAWWRFRLRTLLVGLTLFAVWLGWNVNIVLQRKAMRRWIERTGGRAAVDGQSAFLSGETYVPWFWRQADEQRWRLTPWRRLMGDQPMDTVVLPPHVEARDLHRVQMLFPEVRMINVLASEPAVPAG
jgi:hypothetical protein